MNVRSMFVQACIGAIAAAGTTVYAAPLAVNEALNFLVMQEAATSALRVLDAIEPLQTGQQLTSSQTYSASSFTYTMTGALNGKPLTLAFQGTQTGSFGEDLTVAFSGAGQWGSVPLALLHGESIARFDLGLNDYPGYSFSELMRVGTGTFWGWVVLGVETAGAVAAGVVVGVGSAPFIGPGGVVSGIVAGGKAEVLLVGASAAGVYVVTETPAEPSPPPAPPPTQVNPLGVFPQSDRDVLVLALPDGTFAVNNGFRVTSHGVYGSGVANGMVSVIPEPSIVLMMIAGVLVIFAVLHRRRNGSNLTLNT